ncbi:hypothetical protein JYK22_05135, partial [Nonomuraea sp. RK-328]|nr:hypothetical protein [Nonomuraea sp. RK-328]
VRLLALPPHQVPGARPDRPQGAVRAAIRARLARSEVASRSEGGVTSDEISSLYRLGFTQGEAVGFGRAHEEMSREWAAVAARVKATGRTPTAVELAERRRPGGAVYEARMRRHGRDYQGGPVDFLTGQPLITEASA